MKKQRKIAGLTMHLARSFPIDEWFSPGCPRLLEGRQLPDEDLLVSGILLGGQKPER